MDIACCNSQIRLIRFVLKVPEDVIRKMDDVKAVNIISDTFSDQSSPAIGYIENYNSHFNPLDKYIQQVEKK